jgi:hypothetical protein
MRQLSVTIVGGSQSWARENRQPPRRVMSVRRGK